MPNLTYRVIPAEAASPVTANGRTFSPSLPYADLPHGDAAIVAANGWRMVGRVGSTAQRPIANVSEPHPVKPCERYVDTTLGKEIMFDGTQWRDPMTGGIV